MKCFYIGLSRDKEDDLLKKTLYYLLIVVLFMALFYNLIFDIDVFALVVNIGALAGVLWLPRMKQ